MFIIGNSPRFLVQVHFQRPSGQGTAIGQQRLAEREFMPSARNFGDHFRDLDTALFNDNVDFDRGRFHVLGMFRD